MCEKFGVKNQIKFFVPNIYYFPLFKQSQQLFTMMSNALVVESPSNEKTFVRQVAPSESRYTITKLFISICGVLCMYQYAHLLCWPALLPQMTGAPGAAKVSLVQSPIEEPTVAVPAVGVATPARVNV